MDLKTALYKWINGDESAIDEYEAEVRKAMEELERLQQEQASQLKELQGYLV